MSNSTNLAGADDQKLRYDQYLFRENEIVHELAIGNLQIEAVMPAVGERDDPKSSWWLSYLGGNQPKAVKPLNEQLRTVDLFCGPGGLANGVRQLCAELGVRVISELIIDQDEGATHVYAANHETRKRRTTSVNQLIDYSVQRTSECTKFPYRPELIDRQLALSLKGVDLLLAGPPCQGHSNLNNHTRRTDPRNDLYLAVPAFAVAIGAPMCIIENVPMILRDSGDVVNTAKQLFENAGYSVTEGRISAADTGWPQTRERHFLIARLDCPPISISTIASLLRDNARPLWWAISHLEEEVGDGIMEKETELSEENHARIKWLFDNDEYNLALEERPESHRMGTTYTAVYGRLRKERPAPTITTGFMSPGRGRYIHPTKKRVLTAHEAARLQGFPDNYRFVPDPQNPPPRAQLAKWIGDAVPMPLGYAGALAVLGSGWPTG